MKKTIANINKTKRWFFEKIIKIDKPLARNPSRKKWKKAQNNKIRNEKGGKNHYNIVIILQLK